MLHDTRQNYYLCIDPNHCVSVSPINIPHYPAVNDVIEVEASVYCTVAEVDTKSEQVKCNPLRKVGSCNPRWKPSLLETVTCPFSNLIRNVCYDKHAGCISCTSRQLCVLPRIVNVKADSVLYMCKSIKLSFSIRK